MSELESNNVRRDTDVPVVMRKVYRELQRWRSERKGRERIPEALWTAAGEPAREHGVNQVSQVLHLEFNHLKRVAEAGGAIGRERTAPAFGGTDCATDIGGTRMHPRAGGTAREAAD